MGCDGRFTRLEPGNGGQHYFGGGLGGPRISRLGERADQRPREPHCLGGRVRHPRLHGWFEQRARGRDGLPRPSEFTGHLRASNLRRPANPAPAVHVYVEPSALEAVRLLRRPFQRTKQLRELRSLHSDEPGRYSWRVIRQRTEEHPSDLLELVPLEQAPDYCLHSHGVWHRRNGGQAGCLPALFDREHRETIRTRFTVGVCQDLGVIQQAACIARRLGCKCDELRTRR